jgi:hypothetical protein
MKESEISEAGGKLLGMREEGLAAFVGMFGCRRNWRKEKDLLGASPPD